MSIALIRVYLKKKLIICESRKERGFFDKNSQGWKRNKNQSFNQNPFQQQQPLYPSSQERISKLEDILEKFMQTTLSHQKNFDIAFKNLETHLGQIVQQLKKI